MIPFVDCALNFFYFYFSDFYYLKIFGYVHIEFFYFFYFFQLPNLEKLDNHFPIKSSSDMVKQTMLTTAACAFEQLNMNWSETDL